MATPLVDLQAGRPVPRLPVAPTVLAAAAVAAAVVPLAAQVVPGGAAGLHPGGAALAWRGPLVALTVVSDVLIGVAYVAISAGLVTLARRAGRSLPFLWAFVAFGAFIVACGLTHLVAAVTVWEPVWWTAAGVKYLTALVSVGTALAFPPVVPRVLAIVAEARASAAAKAALRESEARFRTAFEHAASGIVLMGMDGRLLRANPAFCALAGAPEAALLGTALADLVHPADRTPGWPAAGAAERDRRLLRPDGTVAWVRASVSVVPDAAGGPSQMVALVEDIAARREAEAADLARAEAETANRLKSAFLATMSHELRTPLTAIMGYAHLLLAEPDGMSADQVGDVRQIAAGADRLLALVNDVLDLTRIEAGGITLAPQAIDVAAAVADALAAVRPQAAAKGLALAADLPPDLRVVADPLRFRQILLNLVGNAVKFTEAGSVAVSARAAGGWLEVAVRDTGIGIPPAELPRVFDEFRQADGSTTRRYGGSGLGLAITKKLVELHGGTIAAESDPGAGSVFTVRLPRGEGSERAG